MKLLLSKLNHALTTKDWRLVEEAWAMADCMTNNKPIETPWDYAADLTMQQMMVQRESD